MPETWIPIKIPGIAKRDFFNTIMRILVAEDDIQLGKSLAEDLRQAGYTADISNDGLDAEFRGSTESYDLVILDLGLPGLSGLEILEGWRARDIKVPVIVLTARGAWQERVDGFKAGADDYICKPFYREELMARIKAVLMRTHGQPPGKLSVLGMDLDETRQRVCIDAREWINLSSTEFKMLRAFMLHPGQILSKTHLTEHLFSPDLEPDSNVIEVYITKLRQKIGHNRIETRRGQGYLLVNPSHSSLEESKKIRSGLG